MRENVTQRFINATGIARLLNFNRPDTVRPEQIESTITHQLAPSFGTLALEQLTLIDTELQTAIGTVIDLLRDIPSNECTWQRVHELFLQHPLLQSYRGEGASTPKTDRLVREGFSWFKFMETPEQAVIDEINLWFTTLLGDHDVRAATPIDIHGLARIVASTGVDLENIDTRNGDNEVRKIALDIGILRYPDLQHPYFKLYRIKLIAWSYSKRMLGIWSNKNGITGEYNCSCFEPRPGSISLLSEDTLRKAIQTFEEAYMARAGAAGREPVDGESEN